MKFAFEKLLELGLLKAKFATTGLVATAIEYVLYALLVNYGLALKSAQLLSYAVAMVVNFLLQKRFVFKLQRSTRQAFFGAVLVSLGGMALNFLIYSTLINIEFFKVNHFISKLLATGIVFFYNFYFKRYVFEKKFI